MAILTVTDISLAFGEETIIENISFELQKGEHVGLVGVNGSGKTTLFKTLTGEYTPDTGSAIFSRETVPGYMEQHVCRDLHKTAFEEVMTVFSHLTDMERELEIMVDNGCTVLDVMVDHPVYGQLTGALRLSSRYDVRQFIQRAGAAQPLSLLTEGVHLHTLVCPDEDAFRRVLEELNEQDFLLDEDG